MTDRNTTVVSDGGAGVGIIVAIVIAVGLFALLFFWQPWSSAPRTSGPSVNITTPSLPAAPSAPAPAPAAPAPSR
jgi:hypothetical protein